MLSRSFLCIFMLAGALSCGETKSAARTERGFVEGWLLFPALETASREREDGLHCLADARAFQFSGETVACFSHQNVLCAVADSLFQADKASGANASVLQLGSLSWQRRNVGNGFAYETCRDDVLVNANLLFPEIQTGVGDISQQFEALLSSARVVPESP